MATSTVETTTDALVAAVTAAQHGDPFSPVTIVVPSAIGGLSLRRALALRRPVASLTTMTLPGIARRLGTQGLAAAGRLPLTPAVRRAAVMAAVRAADADGKGLGPAGAHEATIEALERRFDEIRRAGRDATDALRNAPDTESFFEVFDRYLALIADRWYDDADLLREAARRAASDPSCLAGLGTVIVFRPHLAQTTPAESALLDALLAAGGRRVDDGARRDFTATEALVAPDPEAETRLAIRALIDAAADGVPLSRMAVISPGQPYDRLLAELLDASNLPWGGGAINSLDATVPGRMLLQLLELPTTRFSRHAISLLLASGPMTDPSAGLQAQASRWERISREANVVAGEDQWRHRLDAYAAQVDERSAGDRDEAVSAPGDSARSLLSFVEGLAAATTPPAVPSWETYSRWAGDLLVRYLPRHSAPDPEHHDRVLSAIRELGAIDGIGAAPDIDGFLAALRAGLRASAGRRPFGVGIWVGRAHELLGGSFDLVVALGLVEGVVPPRRRDDPLLPDAVRTRTGGALPTRRQRRDAEFVRLEALLAGSERQVLLAAQADQRAQQRRNPSPWLVQWAPAIDGIRPRRGADLPVVPSFTAALQGRPISEQEASVRFLRSGSAPADLGLETAAAAQAARRAAPLGAWDGVVGPHPALDLAGRVVSPTSIETWATCPFRFFLKAILRVKPTSEPEDRLDTDPLDRGSLVHDILESFVRWRIDRGEPSAAEEADALDRFTDETFARYEAEGRVGRPLAWLLEQRHLRAHLATFLDRERDRRDRTGLRPVAAEASFGFPDDPDDLGEVEVEVSLGADRRATLRFRGKVDRIDADVSGQRVRVVDYKTGNSTYYRDLIDKGREDFDATSGGTRLQLPIYALAARRLHPDAAITAAYDFVTDAAAGYREVPVALDETNEARFRDVLDHIAASINDGVFPANPGDEYFDTWTNCRGCDYERVCPSRRGETFEQRKGEAEILRFLELRTRGSATS